MGISLLGELQVMVKNKQDVMIFILCINLSRP